MYKYLDAIKKLQPHIVDLCITFYMRSGRFRSEYTVLGMLIIHTKFVFYLKKIYDMYVRMKFMCACVLKL